MTFTDLGPPTDMKKESLSVLINSIAAYGFECEVGPLENCAEWIRSAAPAEMKEAAN